MTNEAEIMEGDITQGRRTR